MEGKVLNGAWPLSTKLQAALAVLAMNDPHLVRVYPDDSHSNQEERDPEWTLRVARQEHGTTLS